MHSVIEKPLWAKVPIVFLSLGNWLASGLLPLLPYWDWSFMWVAAIPNTNTGWVETGLRAALRRRV